MQAFRMGPVTYRLVLCLSLLSCRRCAVGGVLPSATPRSVSDAVPSARRESGQRSHDVIRRVSPPEGSGPLTALLRNGMTSAPLKGSAPVVRPAKHLPSFLRSDVPFSLAGRRHGQNDDRSAIKPSWVSKSSDTISRKLKSSLSASLYPRCTATASSAETSKEKLASSRSLSALTNSPLDASDFSLIPTSASKTREFSKPATSSSMSFSTSTSAATERTTSTPKAMESSWILSTITPETRTASRATTVTNRALPGSFISYVLRPLSKGETAVAERNAGGSGPFYFLHPRRHWHLGNAADNKDDDKKEVSQDRRRDEHRELGDTVNVDDLVLNGRFQRMQQLRDQDHRQGIEITADQEGSVYPQDNASVTQLHLSRDGVFSREREDFVADTRQQQTRTPSAERDRSKPYREGYSKPRKEAPTEKPLQASGKYAVAKAVLGKLSGKGALNQDERTEGSSGQRSHSAGKFLDRSGVDLATGSASTQVDESPEKNAEPGQSSSTEPQLPTKGAVGGGAAEASSERSSTAATRAPERRVSQEGSVTAQRPFADRKLRSKGGGGGGGAVGDVAARLSSRRMSTRGFTHHQQGTIAAHQRPFTDQQSASEGSSGGSRDVLANVDSTRTLNKALGRQQHHQYTDTTAPPLRSPTDRQFHNSGGGDAASHHPSSTQTFRETADDLDQHEDASRKGADWHRMIRIRSDHSLSSTPTHSRAAGQHRSSLDVGKLRPSSTDAYSRRAGQDREDREEETRQGMNSRSASQVRSDQIPSSTPTLSGAADPAHRRREKERRGGLDWQRMSQVARDLAHRLTGQQLLWLLRQLEAVRRRKTMTASDTVDIADTCCLV